MSNEAVSQFVAIISPCFPTPRFEDDGDFKLWLAVLTKAIGHHRPEAIVKAAETIVFTRSRKRDGSFFPEPSECILACDRAARIVEAEKNARDRPLLAVDKAPKEWSPECHRLALDMLGTPMGLEAVRERWHGALYDFMYARQRMPSPAEVTELKAKSKAFREDIAAIERGELKTHPSFDARKLAQLGRSIAKRREDYARTVEGDA
jgi:hypothetical protein